MHFTEIVPNTTTTKNAMNEKPVLSKKIAIESKSEIIHTSYRILKKLRHGIPCPNCLFFRIEEIVIYIREYSVSSLCVDKPFSVYCILAH